MLKKNINSVYFSNKMSLYTDKISKTYQHKTLDEKDHE